MHFTLFNGNICKLPLHLAEILEIFFFVLRKTVMEKAACLSKASTVNWHKFSSGTRKGMWKITCCSVNAPLKLCESDRCKTSQLCLVASVNSVRYLIFKSEYQTYLGVMWAASVTLDWQLELSATQKPLCTHGFSGSSCACVKLTVVFLGEGGGGGGQLHVALWR